MPLGSFFKKIDLSNFETQSCHLARSSRKLIWVISNPGLATWHVLRGNYFKWFRKSILLIGTFYEKIRKKNVYSHVTSDTIFEMRSAWFLICIGCYWICCSPTGIVTGLKGGLWLEFWYFIFNRFMVITLFYFIFLKIVYLYN